MALLSSYYLDLEREFIFFVRLFPLFLYDRKSHARKIMEEIRIKNPDN